MKKYLISIVSVFAFSTAFAATPTAKPAAPAKDTVGMDLLKSKGCLGCHGMDQKLVGPSYKDVREKYAKDPKAVEKLTEKVLKGGVGVWGNIPMPANAHVSKDEAEKIIKWILTQK